MEFVIGNMRQGDAVYQYQQFFNGGTGIPLVLTGWRGVLGWQSPGASVTAAPDGTIPATGVHHVALVAGSGAITLYVDGKSVVSGTYTKAPATSANVAFGLLGKLYGEVGQLAVYRKALTPAQVQAHASAMGKP